MDSRNRDDFSSFGYLRLREILGDKHANPPIPAIIPVSRSQWYRMLKDGRAPAPIRLGPRTSCYKISDILAMCEQ